MEQRTHRAGFTLVELLVVIAIISLLAGLLIPTVNVIRERANRAACLNNVREIGRLCSIYTDDHRGQFPFEKTKKEPLAYESLQKLVEWDPDNVLPALFVSPVHRDDPAVVDDQGSYTLGAASCSYAYVGELTRRTDSPSLPLLSNDSIKGDESRSEGHRGGLNVVYVGLNAEWVNAEDLPEGRRLPAGLVGNTTDEYARR